MLDVVTTSISTDFNTLVNTKEINTKLSFGILFDATLNTDVSHIFKMIDL